MKRTVSYAVIALVGISLAGCNTIRGAGQDIERAGEAVQDSTN
ncbi:entericidin A/B family lipoprotein [Maricaulis sp.]